MVMKMKTKLAGMKGSGFSLVIVCLSVSWTCSVAFAAVPPPLSKVIEMVLSRHPAVREAELNLTSAQLELDATRASAVLPKIKLQKLATELDIEISVCYFFPRTNKWNKIEHEMFSYILKN